MKSLLGLALFFIIISCTPHHENKIQCYAWIGGPGKATDTELKSQFTDLKEKGIEGLMYSAGQEPQVYQRVG